MKMLSLGPRVAAIAVVILLGSTGGTSIVTVYLPLAAVDDSEGHRSSLRAKVMMTDGTTRTITLQGVGCTESLCSRVRAMDINADGLWLDGLVSVREISQETQGFVRAVFRFKNGVERQASIVPGNRVLYVKGRLGRTEKLDLARLTKMDFE